MIDISKGRYWDLPWSLVDGCTPCSPGCRACWSAAMTHHYHGDLGLTDMRTGQFRGQILTRPERLSIPLKRRKPTVFSIWNDLFHKDVPPEFTWEAFEVMRNNQQHTFLVLTKRPPNISPDYFEIMERCLQNIFLGLTICNQQEADAKIPVFLQVPGKRFISVEPMLGPIDLQYAAFNGADSIESLEGIHAVILGGETGPGARPINMAWVQSIRDQCRAANVPFFFKSWGDYWRGGIPKEAWKTQGRLLDGRTHDDLPWAAKRR